MRTFCRNTLKVGYLYRDAPPCFELRRSVLTEGFQWAGRSRGTCARQLPPLLAGKAGLVNECLRRLLYSQRYCNVQSCHGPSHLEDLRKLVDLIIDTADRSIKDLQRRREIELQARRYLARHAIGIIASHRRRGAKLAEVLPVIWQSRRDLSQFGLGNVFRLTTPLALLLLPRSAIRWLRRFRRVLR